MGIDGTALNGLGFAVLDSDPVVKCAGVDMGVVFVSKMFCVFDDNDDFVFGIFDLFWCDDDVCCVIDVGKDGVDLLFGCFRNLFRLIRLLFVVLVVLVLVLLLVSIWLI
jgi:energy-converting hydrogenase Eha subunit E